MTEKPHAGRPRGMARASRRAYMLVRPDTLIVPRAQASRLECAVEVGAGPPVRKIASDRLKAHESLYEYQEAVVSYLCDPEAGPLGEASVSAGRGVAYLQMDTGLGKTRVACAVVARRRAPALVVVPTQAIADQWVDEFHEIYPRLRAQVYHNSAKRRPAPDTHDVVVVIINTFREKDPDFMRGYGTTVLDEAHEYHSPCNAKALWLAQTPAVLGLSATPLDKPDGLDRYVCLHLGDPIPADGIPGFDAQAVNFSGMVRTVKYAGNPEYCATVTTGAGTMSAVLTIEGMLGDPARLRLVAAETERLFRLHETAPDAPRLGLGPRPPEAATPTHPAGEVRRHGVFVFAELRDYLPALRDALLERLAPEEIYAPELPPISILRGGASREEVGHARDASAHIVLTTYGYSRRGLSLQKMTAIVMATPRRNGLRQVLGRIFRRGSDESIVRQIVDIVDVRTGLRSQYSSRKLVYKERDYPVTECQVSWGDYVAPDAEIVASAGAAGSDAPEAPRGGPKFSLEDLETDQLIARLCAAV